MKTSIKLSWHLGILIDFLSNTGITTGNPLAFSSSVYKKQMIVDKAQNINILPSMSI